MLKQFGRATGRAAETAASIAIRGQRPGVPAASVATDAASIAIRGQRPGVPAASVTTDAATLAAITGRGGPLESRFFNLTGPHSYQNVARGTGRPKGSNISTLHAFQGPRANTTPVINQRSPGSVAELRSEIEQRGFISQMAGPGGINALIERKMAEHKRLSEQLAEVKTRLSASERQVQEIASTSKAKNAQIANIQRLLANSQSTKSALERQLANTRTAAEAGQASEVARVQAAAEAEKEAAIQLIRAEYEQQMQQLQASLVSRSTANAATRNAALRNLRSQMNTRIQEMEAAKQAAINAAVQGSEREMRSSFEAQLAKARGELGPIQTELAQTKDQIRDLTAQLEAAQGQTRTLATNRESATRRVQELTAQLREAEGQLQTTATNRNSATRRVEELTGQLEAAQTRAQQLNATVAERNAATRRVEELTAELSEAQGRAQQLNVIAAERNAATRRVENLTRQLESRQGNAAQRNAVARRRLQSLTAQLEAAQSRAQATVAERNAALERTAALNAELGAARTRAQELEATREQITDLSTQLNRALNENRRLGEQLDGAQRRANELNGRAANRNTAARQVENLNEQLEGARAQIQQLTSRLQNATARAAALNASKEANVNASRALFEEALEDSNRRLKEAVKEAEAAKEAAARAKEEGLEQLKAEKEAIERSYQEELEAARKEMARLKSTINTTNKAGRLQSELNAMKGELAAARAAAEAELQAARASLRDEVARMKGEYDALLGRARANADNAKRLLSESEQEVQRLRKDANARKAVVVAPPQPPPVIVAPKPSVPNIVEPNVEEPNAGVRRTPGLLMQKIGKRGLVTNPLIVNKLEKKLKNVDSKQDLLLIADSISCRDLSKLLSGTTADLNAFRADDEGPETPLSDLGIQLALNMRKKLINDPMDHVLIAPIYKTIQTAILLFGSVDEIIQMFPTLASSRAAIDHRLQPSHLYVVEASSMPGPSEGARRGLFARNPRDPSSDRIPFSDLQSMVPASIDFSYLQKIQIDYSYSRLMNIITEIARKTIEDDTYESGAFAFIGQRNIIRDMYNLHSTNKAEKPISEEQPYHLEMWKTTFDLAATDKALTLNEIILPTNQIKDGSLSMDSIWSYGKACKWTYKKPLHGTRKKGGRRRLQTRRR